VQRDHARREEGKVHNNAQATGLDRINWTEGDQGRTVRHRRANGLRLVDELQRSQRFTLWVLVSVLLLSLATSGYLILVSQPRISGYVALAKEARDAHDGMLDQETGLRGWLATGNPLFLEPYRTGKQQTETAVSEVLEAVRGDNQLTRSVVAMLLARQRWQEWASDAATKTYSPTQRVDGTLTSFLLKGKGLFDSYRAAENRSAKAILERREAALEFQNYALVVVLLSYLVLLAVTGALTIRRRRRLQRTVVAPVAALHKTVTRLRTGDLSARAEPSAVEELADIGDALGDLATELAQAGIEATARERRLAKLAYRFETVVRVGREIAGSLSVRYVSASVTTAAAELLNASTVLWLRGEAQAFEVVAGSEDEQDVAPPKGQPPPGIVARAAAEAQVVIGDGARAYPLVLAGMVTAVLEVRTSTVDPDTEQVLHALLSTAAASLESAQLHSTARELADLDGLTRLPNRRRFELDVDTEWERCRRYGRPLSLVMMDLDHFKRLNDEHGHLLGDEVLRAVAKAVEGVLRSTDTAYRYGGEELVALFRETGLEEATSAAERLREAVGSVTLPDNPRVKVTTSAGVATRHTGMSHYTELVAEADEALYDAKRRGRDRVVTARGPSETLLFHGDANEVGDDLDDSSAPS
jgi:diguanylate cyclase (GGDEF)-like protein